MNGNTMAGQSWVAFGPVGAIGSIHHTEDGYVVRMLEGSTDERTYESLEAAKSAVHAAMGPNTERPEFREH